MGEVTMSDIALRKCFFHINDTADAPVARDCSC